ncbi:MAG: SMC-Scp complex subunit ScpB [Clostridia bacterium]|nr:SMC-Scp complex subunit ScpB [Clostridia bacterium]
MKKLEKLTNIIEAILFAAGDAVPIDLIREKLEITKREMDSAIRDLERKYTGACGIRLLHINHKLQFATNPEYKEPVAAAIMPLREKEFTKTILECAAIVAYKQPITRGEIEAIRQTNSDYAISTLLSLEMIAPCGRKDAPGRPMLYETTDNFLRRFKLKSLAELPDYDELLKKIADLGSIDELTSSYLYEKDVYNPETDEEYAVAENAQDEGNFDEE